MISFFLSIIDNWIIPPPLYLSPLLNNFFNIRDGLGMYIGLTGERLNAKDLIYRCVDEEILISLHSMKNSGLATHYVAKEHIDDGTLIEKIEEIVNGEVEDDRDLRHNLNKLLREYTLELDEKCPQLEPKLEPNAGRIKRIFGYSNGIEAKFSALRNDDISDQIKLFCEKNREDGLREHRKKRDRYDEMDKIIDDLAEGKKTVRLECASADYFEEDSLYDGLERKREKFDSESRIVYDNVESYESIEEFINDYQQRTQEDEEFEQKTLATLMVLFFG